MPLTDTVIKNSKPRAKSYKLSDQKGLYVQVEPTGSKLWRLKYRFGGKEKRLAFGAYPDVTLARARERQLEARRLLADGVDPGEYKKQTRRAMHSAAANTFEAVAREWYTRFSPGWADSHSDKTIGRLEKDIFPWLGSRPVSRIEAPELLETVRRIEARGALDTAHRCLGICGQVFRYAIATARARRDPSADLRGALPPPRTEHFASITEPEKVGELLRAIEGYRGSLVTRCALRLAPLVFVRPAELRHAEWSEFNFNTPEWRILGSKMKMAEDLIVPLAGQTIDVITELRPLTGRGRFLFPSDRTLERPMSNNTVNAALRRLGYPGSEITGHGFRAMARTILDEVLGFRPDLIEHQLAHKVKDPNGRAYNRTAFLEQRKEMMQRWADYLDRLREGKAAAAETKRAA